MRKLSSKSMKIWVKPYAESTKTITKYKFIHLWNSLEHSKSVNCRVSTYPGFWRTEKVQNHFLQHERKLLKGIKQPDIFQSNSIIQQSNNILLHKHQQTIQTNHSSQLKAMDRYGYLQSKWPINGSSYEI